MTITSQIHYNLSAWATSHAYTTIGTRISNSGNAYQLVTAGTSAASGGPTTTGSSITDGSCVWKYLSSIDFTSLLAWGASFSEADLTQAVVASLWNNGTITTTSGTQYLDLSNYFGTSPTNTVTVQCAQGESYRDTLAGQSTPLAFNAAAGVSFTLPATGTGATNYLRLPSNSTIIGVQFQDPNSGSGSTIMDGGPNGAVNLYDCLYDGYVQTSAGGMVGHSGGNVANCTFINRGANNEFGWCLQGFNGDSATPISVYNCLFLNTVSGNNTAAGFNNNNSSGTANIVKNSMFFGFSDTSPPIGSSGATNNIDHCIFSNTSNSWFSSQHAVDGGGNLFSKITTNQFVNPATDFRILRTADALNAGPATTTSMPVTDDVAGTSRPQGTACDIGPWELVLVQQTSAAITGTGLVTPVARAIEHGQLAQAALGTAVARAALLEAVTASTVAVASVTVNATHNPAAVANIALTGNATATTGYIAGPQAVLSGSGQAVSDSSHTAPAAPTLAGSGQLIGNATHTPQAVVSLGPVSGVAVDGLHISPGSAVFAGSGSLSLSTLFIAQAVAGPAGAATVTLNATHTPQAAVQASGVGTVLPNAILLPITTSTLGGSGGVSSTASHTPTAAPPVSGTANVTVTAANSAGGSVTVVGTGQAASSPILIDTQAALTISGNGVASATSTHTPQADTISSPITGAGSVMVGADRVPPQNTILSGAGTIFVPFASVLDSAVISIGATGGANSTALLIVQPTASSAGVVNVAASAIHTPQAAATIAVAGSAAATALIVNATNPVAIAPAGSLSASQFVLFAGAPLALAGAGSVLAGIAPSLAGSITLPGTAAITTAALAYKVAVPQITGIVGIVVQATHTPQAAIGIAPLSTVTLVEVTVLEAQPNLMGTGGALATATHTPFASATIQGSGSVALFVGSSILTAPMAIAGSGSIIVEAVHDISTSATITGTGGVATLVAPVGVARANINGLVRIRIDALVYPEHDTPSISGEGHVFVAVNIKRAPHPEPLAPWRTIVIGRRHTKNKVIA
jgi:hypothetical protein